MAGNLREDATVAHEGKDGRTSLATLLKCRPVPCTETHQYEDWVKLGPDARAARTLKTPCAGHEQGAETKQCSHSFSCVLLTAGLEGLNAGVVHPLWHREVLAHVNESLKIAVYSSCVAV